MSGLKLLLLAGYMFGFVIALTQDDSAELIEVVASADRTQVQIADPFECEIKVTAPEGTKVSFPEFEGTIGPFDILEFKDDRAEGIWTRKLVLETIETGRLEIPSIEVSVQEEDSPSRLIRTKPIGISVTSVVEASSDLTKFNDIASLIDVEEPERSSAGLFWIVVVSALALAAAAGCLMLASRRSAIESASVWALRKLDEADGDFRRTEGILRSFLEERFGFPAVSLGSAALMGQLSEQAIDKKLVSEVEEILAVSERVKFGGYTLSQQQSLRLNNSARNLISQLGINAVASDHEERV